MRLKDYQAAVLDKLSSYLKLLSEQAAKAEKTRAAIAALPEEARSNLTAPLEPTVAAWDEARQTGVAASPDAWRDLKDGIGQLSPTYASNCRRAEKNTALRIALTELCSVILNRPPA